MSTTTIVNSLPKALRDELKTTQLYDACFTDESRKTIKPGFAMLVPQGLEKMIENRQELLLGNYIVSMNADTVITATVLLRDIEVLRLILTLLAREAK